ncbi:MAG TPA: ferritin-like domain-containing protein [Thermoanaerobaculia bacterium]|nr:ferritin-like domain-containing protein [Thermoanaerobaculia bacterium]
MSTVPGESFVASLLAEMRGLFDRLGAREALESESDGRVDIPTLLRLALKSEVEAAEIAGLWMPSTLELDVKSAFARQASDEMRHYELICKRLEDLGEDPEELVEEHSALYTYLTSLQGSVERVAAGPFAREAIAEVRNAQFIELCLANGDQITADLYVDVIQPEEVHHHELGCRLLEKYAVTEELQRQARDAMRSSLAIADELRTLTEKSTGLQGVLVS